MTAKNYVSTRVYGGVRRLTATEKTAHREEFSRAIVREIAMDIGKAVVHHIETMYPAAVAACPSTFRLSVRNCVHNEIIAAIEVSDEGEIVARLKRRKSQRRKIKAMYENIRSNP